MTVKASADENETSVVKTCADENTTSGKIQMEEDPNWKDISHIKYCRILFGSYYH